MSDQRVIPSSPLGTVQVAKLITSCTHVFLALSQFFPLGRLH